MGTVLTMRAVSTGGNESALVSVDVPLTGNIVGVEWTGYTAFDTTLDLQVWQLSFGSTVAQTNDSRQIISMASAGEAILVTSGVYLGKVDKYSAIPDVPVGMGERLYLHSIAAASVVGVVYALLHFDFDLDKVAVRRR